MKFILIIWLCSQAIGSCKDAKQSPILFDNWSTCIEAGLLNSLELLHSYPMENRNKFRMYIKYTCKVDKDSA